MGKTHACFLCTADDLELDGLEVAACCSLFQRRDLYAGQLDKFQALTKILWEIISRIPKKFKYSSSACCMAR